MLPSFSYSNIDGIGPIVDDMLETIIDPLELALYLPSVLYADYFSIDITVNVIYFDEVLGTRVLPAKIVEVNPIIGLTAVINSNVITLSGNHISSFDDNYIFIDNPKYVINRKVDKVRSLIEYIMPPDILQLIPLPFTITMPSSPFGSGPETTIHTELYQWVYWTVLEAEKNIKLYVSEGL
jgi:hypothetical protein